MGCCGGWGRNMSGYPNRALSVSIASLIRGGEKSTRSLRYRPCAPTSALWLLSGSAIWVKKIWVFALIMRMLLRKVSRIWISLGSDCTTEYVSTNRQSRTLLSRVTSEYAPSETVAISCKASRLKRGKHDQERLDLLSALLVPEELFPDFIVAHRFAPAGRPLPEHAFVALTRHVGALRA